MRRKSPASQKKRRSPRARRKSPAVRLRKETLDNTDYRRVVRTTAEMQLVLMNLGPGEKIPMEAHEGHTQLLVIESGRGGVRMGGSRREKIVGSGEAVIIPAGVSHEVKNVGSRQLKLFTVYAPPEHPANLKQTHYY